MLPGKWRSTLLIDPNGHRLQFAGQLDHRGLSEYLPLYTELPIAVKHASMMDDVMANAERVLMTPTRELLIEGCATDDFGIPNVDLASTVLMGALSFIEMIHMTMTGPLDAERVADHLVPMLLHGLLPSD